MHGYGGYCSVGVVVLQSSAVCGQVNVATRTPGHPVGICEVWGY